MKQGISRRIPIFYPTLTHTSETEWQNQTMICTSQKESIHKDAGRTFLTWGSWCSETNSMASGSWPCGGDPNRERSSCWVNQPGKLNYRRRANQVQVPAMESEYLIFFTRRRRRRKWEKRWPHDTKHAFNLHTRMDKISDWMRMTFS